MSEQRELTDRRFDVGEGSEIGACMGFTYRDAKRLWSSVWHKEEQMNRQRRWLMGPPSSSEGIPKRFKKPKVLSKLFLLESDVRSDDVSSEAVRNTVERSFGIFDGEQGSHHVVQDYLQFFESNEMESYAVNPFPFLRTLYGMLDDLNNKALCLVAHMVTANKVRFNKTRPKMKRIIKDYLPEFFAESNPDCLNVLNQLSQIFKCPSNFRDKQLTFLTPLSSSLLSSIHKTLEDIDDMPLQTLIAMNRQLRGETPGPEAPSILSAHKILSGYKRDVLVDRVRRRSNDLISKLKKGDDLPKPLARALSVMRLSIKYSSGCTEIWTSEFFPFPSEVVALQNNILTALWSLPKVKTDELKILHSLLDPEAKVCIKSFRSALRKYLIEYLFRCGETDIPGEVVKVLAIINRSRRRPLACSKEMGEEETETVLIASSQFKNIFLDLLHGSTTEEEPGKDLMEEDLGGVDDNDNNSFILAGNNYCSNSDDWLTQRPCGSCSNYEAETSGDSRPFVSSLHISTNNSNSAQVADATRDFISKEHKANYLYSCPTESTGFLHPNAFQGVDELCDEAGLVVHGFIGHFLDRVFQAEGRELDPMTRSYLRQKSSPLVDFEGAQNSSSTSEEGERCHILIQVAEQLLPCLPQSSIESVKEMMRPL